MKGLPSVGRNTSVLPKPSPLFARFDIEEKSVTVYVTADILGDVRPVCGADVKFASQIKATDENGVAVFNVPDKGRHIMNIFAGDTFLPSEIEIYM